MSRRFRGGIMAAAIAAGSLLSLISVSLPASASASCPVLYRGSRHSCYVSPTTLTVRRAERQMPVRVVDPVAAVRRFTSLPLTAVIVDRTWRDTGKLHPWIIDYVFGHAPDLGLPTATVTASARFLVIGEAVEHVNIPVPGAAVTLIGLSDFQRIRVNGRGVAIWHVSKPLPNRSLSLVIHSTLSSQALQGLVAALTQEAG